MYHLIIGFLLGIIFTTAILLYVFFRLLSKKIDPRSLPKDKSLKLHHQQQQQQLQHSNQHHKQRTHKKSFYFTSTNDPIDFSIGKDTPPTSIETCKWVNFITKRLLSEINHSQQYSRHIHELLNGIAEDESKPDYIGKLSFSDINIGTTTPEIGTIRLVSPVNASVNVIEFDLIYSGDASITASTELWLNWPQKHTACLPVKTKISIKQFTGNFVLYLPNHTNPLCSMYLKESPSLTLRMVTKMGHETVLKEPGKIGQFIQNFIVKTLNQKVVSPNRISFPLFNFLHPAVSNSALSLISSIPTKDQQQQQSSSSTSSSQPVSTSSTPLSSSTTSSPATTSMKQSVSSGSIISLSGGISSNGSTHTMNGLNGSLSTSSSTSTLPSQKKGIKHRKPHHPHQSNSTMMNGAGGGNSATSTPSLSSSNSATSSISSSTSISAPTSTQTSPSSSPAINNHHSSSPTSLTTPLNLVSPSI